MRNNRVLTAILLLSLAIAATQSFAKIDSSKYITVDEIKTDMQAYCLTVYEGTKIEKFPLKIITTVKNHRPGQDAILVMGTDPRFEHTGPVAGCSGSPVFIDGRLAGALAFGWNYSKDPLYGVTPIEEMLAVGSGQTSTTQNKTYLDIDFSKPVDFKMVAEKYKDFFPRHSENNNMFKSLSVPLAASMPQQCLDFMNEYLGDQFMAVAAGQSAEPSKNIKLERGSIIAIPLVSGDFSMSAIGTVTEVVDNKVYGFGHAFDGIGKVDLPMATGHVNHVVANIISSFKFGQADKIVGSLKADESAAIYGIIGDMPNLIPITININRFNDKSMTYNCKLVDDKNWTPMMAAVSTMATIGKKGALPHRHTIKYSVNITLEDNQTIQFSETLSDTGERAPAIELMSIIAALMDNTFKPIAIKSIALDFDINDQTSAAIIKNVSLFDNAVKAGQTISLAVELKRPLAEPIVKQLKFDIPKDLKPGQYRFSIAGKQGYLNFVKSATPQKFTAKDEKGIIKLIKNITQPSSNNIYMFLETGSAGVTVDNHELKDLPLSKAIPLASPKRTTAIRPYKKWSEKRIETDLFIIGSKTINITIEK